MKRDARSLLLKNHEFFLFVRPVDVAALETFLKVAGGLAARGAVPRVVGHSDLNV